MKLDERLRALHLVRLTKATIVDAKMLHSAVLKARKPATRLLTRN